MYGFNKKIALASRMQQQGSGLENGHDQELLSSSSNKHTYSVQLAATRDTEALITQCMNMDVIGNI